MQVFQQHPSGPHNEETKSEVHECPGKDDQSCLYNREAMAYTMYFCIPLPSNSSVRRYDPSLTRNSCDKCPFFMYIFLKTAKKHNFVPTIFGRHVCTIISRNLAVCSGGTHHCKPSKANTHSENTERERGQPFQNSKVQLQGNHDELEGWKHTCWRSISSQIKYLKGNDKREMVRQNPAQTAICGMSRKKYKSSRTTGSRKDMVNQTAHILNLERNKCIDSIDRHQQTLTTGKQ